MADESYYVVIKERDTVYKHHATQKQAEDEARRLSIAHPGTRFHVLGVLSYLKAPVPESPKPELTRILSARTAVKK